LRPRGLRLVVGAMLCGVLPLWTAAAQELIPTSQHDTTLPIEITADALEVEQEAQRAIFTGAVDVIQGDVRLNADRLVVYYSDQEAAEQNAIYRIDVEGNVRFATPSETAKGDTGSYDVDAGIIELNGDVVLTSGQEAVINGNKLIMNLTTGQSEVTGGRVKGIFVPDQSDGT
jgi:lipopolysaccharide export system protein LptA